MPPGMGEKSHLHGLALFPVVNKAEEIPFLRLLLFLFVAAVRIRFVRDFKKFKISQSAKGRPNTVFAPVVVRAEPRHAQAVQGRGECSAA